MTETTTGVPTWARQDIPATTEERVDAVGVLGDFLGEYDSRETIRKYRANLSEYFLWCERYYPHVSVVHARTRMVRRYRQYLKSNHWEDHWGADAERCRKGQCAELPYGAVTIDAKMSAVSSFYSFCMEEELRDGLGNPVPSQRGRKNRGQRGQQHAHDILMPQEIYDVMQQCKEATTSASGFKIPTLRYAAVFGIMVGAGLRVEELAGARAEGLGANGTSRTLRFQRKGGGWQTLDLPRTYAPILDTYLHGRATGPLILNERQRRRNPETGELEHAGLGVDALRDVVTEIATVTGVRARLHPHLLRHTAITLALTDPATNLQRVSVYYGHDSVKTTMGYYNYHRLLSPGAHINFYAPDWKTQGLVRKT